MTDNIAARRERAAAQQARLVQEPAPFFVRACPGSGKTRVIIERHLCGPATAHPGRALVSFTRASSAELRRRCHAQRRPELAEFPHFVGTLDRFLWQFLVRPTLTPQRRWQRIDSWDRINARVNGRWALGDFTFRRNPDETQCRVELQVTGRNRTNYLALAGDTDRIVEIEEAALKLRNRLVARGYLTGHEVRHQALHGVRTDFRQVRSILVERFAELVVDEAQDCNLTDIAILDQLRRAGLPMILVGDLDQAIYEFRDARPDQVQAFGAQLGKTLRLDGNWRSSAPICALANTLRRNAASRPDDAIGEHHDETTPVLLLPTKRKRVESACSTFTSRAADLDVPAHRQLILAHKASALPGPARWRAGSAGFSTGTKQLAWAAAVLEQLDRNANYIEEALTVIERALLRVWCPITDELSIEDICEDNQISRLDLRRCAMSISLPSLDCATFAEWCSHANTVLTNLPPAPHLELRRKGRLAARRDGSDPPRKVIRVAAASPGIISARTEVIHQVKGGEADAVLLIIPADRHLTKNVDSWIAGGAEDNERLRVLYVAATRARRLLAIAAPEDSCDRLARNLADRGVPLEMRT